MESKQEAALGLVWRDGYFECLECGLCGDHNAQHECNYYLLKEDIRRGAEGEQPEQYDEDDEEEEKKK